jgi:hydroxypyruvate isomerase
MLAATTLIDPLMRAEGAWAQAGSLNDRFSIMIWVLRKRGTFEQNLEMVAKAGYRHIQLIGEFFKWTDAEHSQYMKKMASLGITVDATAGMKLGFADSNDPAAYVAELKKLIVAAKRVKCSRLILMSGKMLPAMGDEKQRAASIETLKQCVPVLEAEGMDAIIEPIDRLENPTYWMDGVEEAATISRAVGSPRIRVLYDLYHEQRTRGNLLAKLEKVIDQVPVVHVADVPRRSDPGTGEVLWPNVYRALKRLDYKGMIAMEFYPDADPVEALRKALLEAEKDLG